MTGFYGKTYKYKDKVIGVCDTLNAGVFMVGHATTGGHKRMKALPVCQSVTEMQTMLDEFARAKGLMEVQA